MKNYNMIFVIYLALHLGPIAELTAWKLISSKKIHIWNKVKRISDPESNYSRYRRLKTNVDPNEPMILILGTDYY